MRAKNIVAVGALMLAGTAGIAQAAEQRVVSFDHGSLDTLDALGLGDQVVGVPKQALPAYLQKYQADRFTDVGGLKTPDVAAVAAVAPTLILATGRQGDAVTELEKVSVVREISMGEVDYWQTLSSKVLGLADYFDKAEDGQRALDELKAHIDNRKTALDAGQSLLVVTQNDGNFSLRNEPVVYDLLGFSVPQLPEGVETITRGTRQFTPLTLDNIVATAPDQLLIVDRSEAIGQHDKAVDVDALRAELNARGGESIAINYLSPNLWYLSGAGLESVRLQVDEVAGGF